MSKRFPNRYPKQPRDFYPTPLATVLPLVPFLKAARVRDFCEPCAGEGHLVRHLESFGFRCICQGDIKTGQDALDIARFDAPPITNPPFSRKSTPALKALIRHFIANAPFSWVLLPVERASAGYMKPFLLHCSHIVVAGRDQWLENGKNGTTDLGWFRFELAHRSGPIFHHGESLLGMSAVVAATAARHFNRRDPMPDIVRLAANSGPTGTG